MGQERRERYHRQQPPEPMPLPGESQVAPENLWLVVPPLLHFKVGLRGRPWFFGDTGENFFLFLILSRFA